MKFGILISVVNWKTMLNQIHVFFNEDFEFALKNRGSYLKILAIAFPLENKKFLKFQIWTSILYCRFEISIKKYVSFIQH